MKRIIGLALALAIWLATAALAAAQQAAPPAAVPTATPIPRPAPVSSATSGRGATINLYFDKLAQGQVGVLQAAGPDLAGLTVRFADRAIEGFLWPGEGYFALIAPRMEQSARRYNLDVYLTYADELRETVNLQVEVTGGGFITQDVPLAADKTYLLDPELERAELARLESLFSIVTPQMLWRGSRFDLPIPGGTLTSPFGAFRTFNRTFQTRHTGWDIRAAQGQPVLASAAGTVAFAGFLDIRGSIVVVDHGCGVYSTYSHLSQVHVTRGQSVTAGQVLGTVGATGRTSGAHFHWEIAVNGVFVDAARFIQTWLPGTER